jgi:hypothetical protein
VFIKDVSKIWTHGQIYNCNGGGGITIVDSVDKLDSDAPLGSLASVATNTVSEVKFSELHQPTSDEVNLDLSNIEVYNTTNLSRVNCISVNRSYDNSIDSVNFLIFLFSKDFNKETKIGTYIMLDYKSAVVINLET